MTKNEQAFIDMVAACEGTWNEYRALFGYHPTRHPDKVFAAPPWVHPNIKTPFQQTDGSWSSSSASGRYQMIWRTWMRAAKALGAPDFSPPWQDAAALWVIDVDGDAIDDVGEGRWQQAVEKCGGIWASLPSSRYPQPIRTVAFARAAYLEAGGVIA